MFTLPSPDELSCDLWQYLASVRKPIVLYGMGNGADKVLSAFDTYGISAADVFASDEFVRGQSFHGRKVLTYADVCRKYPDFIVCVSFGTSLAEVQRKIAKIAAERETYIPDVPAFGETLFTNDFFQAHYAEFCEVFSLLADADSKRIFAEIIRYKLTGNPDYLQNAVCEALPTAAAAHQENHRVMIDAGAYTGDTAKSFIDRCPNAQTVYAIEPDRRSFEKLSRYAEAETRASVCPCRFAAWNTAGEADFAAGGSRNSGIGAQSGKKAEYVPLNTIDSLQVTDADFLKFDVEGAEAEALTGAVRTIRASFPDLQIAVYHRSEDLYRLPLLVHRLFPAYSLYLRRAQSVPAWDIDLYAVKEI